MIWYCYCQYNSTQDLANVHLIWKLLVMPFHNLFFEYCSILSLYIPARFFRWMFNKKNLFEKYSCRFVKSIIGSNMLNIIREKLFNNDLRYFIFLHLVYFQKGRPVVSLRNAFCWIRKNCFQYYKLRLNLRYMNKFLGGLFLLLFKWRLSGITRTTKFVIFNKAQ